MWVREYLRTFAGDAACLHGRANLQPLSAFREGKSLIGQACTADISIAGFLTKSSLTGPAPYSASRKRLYVRVHPKRLWLPHTQGALAPDMVHLPDSAPATCMSKSERGARRDPSMRLRRNDGMK